MTLLLSDSRCCLWIVITAELNSSHVLVLWTGTLQVIVLTALKSHYITVRQRLVSPACEDVGVMYFYIVMAHLPANR